MTAIFAEYMTSGITEAFVNLITKRRGKNGFIRFRALRVKKKAALNSH